ncbi:MAG: 4-(cytidine 5'-diphospho)-2-C-methyl-D-erythritol kinase [Methylophilales bacterium 28-44-11]|jgi:4-diphosphocytidyl-2-C-methyl-D-erythritol kinase|nr:MAG: 4-(cytidine 5'-diphospho)-2-C-methyl-D-erythritol kinase [Methylophilales bacterium 28-44-11]
MLKEQTFLAPAKINLFLHITGRRADGYHTLQSVFQLLDFYDTLRLSLREDGQIVRINPIENVPTEQDLCVRAARALQLATGSALGVNITLDKQIPMGGGLGGGSSDAATMLLALNQLWSLHLSRQQLMQIGLTLGADVPVFIFGQTAWAEGIGEQLTAIDLPANMQAKTYLVLTPHENVATAQIFANSRLTRDTKPLKIADFSSHANAELFKNDLENVVCEEFPSVASTLQWLNQYGEARMSGSGASVFVTVNSEQEAVELLANKPTNTSGFIAKGIHHHPHFKLAN